MRTILKSDEMHGRLNTRQRHLLLDIIREKGDHIDAKELFRLATERDDRISSATVYRSLHLFKELGLVEEQHLGRGRCSYEIMRPNNHQHLACSKCGKIIDFDCPINELVEKVKRQKGFSVTRAELYLEGHCDRCAGEEKKNAP
jgi:Fur family ferric uptake transcriptional regulator